MATGLDPRFIPLNYLQQYFVDELTGEPMSAGVVSFFSDNNRTTPKAVYTISGSPTPGYTYTSLGSVLTLSGVGTFQDASGNDIAVYAFPLQGTPANQVLPAVVENYYISVSNSNGVVQFTREGVPNQTTPAGSTPTPSGGSVLNYIPNGQFLLNNANAVIPGAEFVYPSLYNTDVTQIAPGGITFERTHGSTATDTITFVQHIAYGSVVGNSPRYSLQAIRTVASSGGDSVCDIRFKFMDVFKFQGQTVTFAFTGLSNAGSVNVATHVIQYFGASGATAVDTIISGGTFTLTGTETIFSVQFTMPTISSSVTGNNDDFLQIALRLPSGAGVTHNVTIDDVYLAASAVTIAAGYFPVTTNGMFVLQALANLAPVTSATSAYYAQDGSNLYLPIIMTQSGFTYDYSQIATIVAKFTQSAVNNELYADGTGYAYSGYSPLGIPYSRLANVLWDSTANAYVFGSGVTYSQAYINSGATTEIILAANALGANTLPANGSSSPGFTYKSLVAGAASSLNFRAYANSSGIVTAISTFSNGTHNGNGAGPGTSGMTVTQNHLTASGSGYYEFNVTALAASALAAGSGSPALYFGFSNHTIDYSLYFVVNGETTSGIPNTLIPCVLESTMNAKDVAIAIVAAINQYSAQTITVGAASGLTSGQYFSFSTNGNATTYNVWYNIAGAGGAPSASNLIPVALAGTETAAQVATATQAAINRQIVAVPDLRGAFLRGTDSASPPNWDVDQAMRYQLFGGRAGASVGSFELDQIISHIHTGTAAITGGSSASANAQASSGSTTTAVFQNSVLTINATGGTESRPVNVYANFYIKY